MTAERHEDANEHQAQIPIEQNVHATGETTEQKARKPAIVRKRCLLWDWTNSAGPGNPGVPWAMDQVDFHGPITAVSNWNTWVPPELKGRAPFRPMVHLKPQLSGQDWKNVEDSHAPIVHFFNEPERAGITPAEAATLWASQMVPLRAAKKTKLVSPSCASDDRGRAWINDFLQRVAHHPPDFLGLHYYGTEAAAAIRYIEDMHKAHASLPIVVSEIASISRDRKQVFEFTARMANWMDGTPWVFEYGVFGCMRKLADDFVSPEAQLMKPDGHFTELMQMLNHEQPLKA